MSKPKVILGISAYYHDSAAVLLIDGEIIAAAQEERFTRVKHTEEFPENAIKFCLEEGGITVDELDAVVFYEKPFLKFERLLQTYYSFAPRGIFSFLKAMPIWLNEKLFLKKRIKDALYKIEPCNKKRIKLLFSSHHLSHAASAFFASPYANAAILTIDGVGEWSTVSIGVGNENKITILKEINFPHSVGLLYSAFTYFLGFKVNSGEYKLMGLAPFGEKDATETKQYVELIKSKLIDIKTDGSIWLNQTYFNYTSGLKMIHEKKWESLFDIKKREPLDEILQSHCNLACAIQQITEEIIIGLAKEAKKVTGLDALTLAGGVALNCVANGKLLELNIFKEIYVQPAANDAGGALGAALAVQYMYFNEARKNTSHDLMKGCFLGPDFSHKEIHAMAKKNKAIFNQITNQTELLSIVAAHLADDKIVGWFQGKMEFGPRALGNRSILANPCSPIMQKKLNLKIKNRESFRPFAPSLLIEDSSEYFEIKVPSPFMLFTSKIKEKYKVNEAIAGLSMQQKLASKRSLFPAVTHLDFSARLHTVQQETNPLFYNLLQKVKEKTTFGVLVNTSFNVRGEPIVCTPNDAFKCFMRTDMNYLVIENFLFKKEDQYFIDDKEKWGIIKAND